MPSILVSDPRKISPFSNGSSSLYCFNRFPRSRHLRHFPGYRNKSLKLDSPNLILPWTQVLQDKCSNYYLLPQKLSASATSILSTENICMLNTTFLGLCRNTQGVGCRFTPV